MKKTVLLLCAVVLTAMHSTHAQTCVRDSSVLLYDSVYISPAPYTPTNPVYGLATACIGQPYNQSVTIDVPTDFLYQGSIPITIINASIATTGAISGLPTGVTYLCDPPNCVFNASTLGCILLYGTPSDPAQAPDTFDLVISANIFGIIFGSQQNIPIAFPGPISPGNYYLILKTAAGCASSAYDLNSRITSLKNVPNPFSDATAITVVSEVSGEFNFEVFDVLGRSIHAQAVNLVEGENQFTFEAGNLPNGSYYYVLSNAEGRASRTMVIAR